MQRADASVRPVAASASLFLRSPRKASNQIPDATLGAAFRAHPPEARAADGRHGDLASAAPTRTRGSIQA